MTKNIVLIGFMGTGKSSVGKILAQKLKRSLFDVDLWVEKMDKRKISEIFEKDGEVYFRALEKQAIKELCSKQAAVITTGGGAVLDADNFRVLKERGVIVALFAKSETVYDRVKDSKHRPLLKKDDVFGEIQKLMILRRPFYEKSDFQFETDSKTPSEVADMILEAIQPSLRGA